MPKARRKPAALPQVEPPQKPTAEAQRHGEYVQGNMGARAVWTNQKHSVLSGLLADKLVTEKQFSAGTSFTATYIRVWGSPSRRDSTQPAVGGIVHETDSQSERMAKDRARLQTVLSRVGPRVYSLLVSVMVFDFNPKGPLLSDLEYGLDECAIAYGVSL